MLAAQAAPDTGAWHSKVRRLRDYWQSIHPPGGGLPGRQHLDPLDIADLLPLVWMVDVQPEPLRFRYRLLGTLHVAAMGRDYTGRWLDEAHENFLTHAAYPHYVSVVRDKVPSYRKGKPGFHVDPELYEMERVLLPMARNGADVDLILAITVYFLRSRQEAFR